jgi:hypothetical protein
MMDILGWLDAAKAIVRRPSPSRSSRVNSISTPATIVRLRRRAPASVNLPPAVEFLNGFLPTRCGLFPTIARK